VSDQILLGTNAISDATHDIAMLILKQHPALNQVVLVGVVDYGFALAQRLSFILNKKTGTHVPVGKLDVTLYRDDLPPRNTYITLKESDIPFGITDKYLILVNHVLSTGRTIRSALNMLADYGSPESIELAVLIEKGNRKIPVFANYVGKKMAHLGEKDRLNIKFIEIDGEDEVRLTKGELK
jgi:pyrimidine operon attenuation protein/uracil phosphoribosyltransferase